MTFLHQEIEVKPDSVAVSWNSDSFKFIIYTKRTSAVFWNNKIFASQRHLPPTSSLPQLNEEQKHERSDPD